MRRHAGSFGDMSIPGKAEKVPESAPIDQAGANRPGVALRKFTTAVQPGRSEYTITHDLETEDVIVQTRIAGRIREGGISVLDANTVQLKFGGVLNETIDLVIIG